MDVVLKIMCFYLVIGLIVVAIIFSSRSSKKKKNSITNDGNETVVETKEVYKNNYKDVYNYSYKNLKEHIEQENGYYRFQEDIQKGKFVKRNKDQQRVFDEYFVVKNITSTTCNPKYKLASNLFKTFSIITFVQGLVMFLTSFAYVFLLFLFIPVVIYSIFKLIISLVLCILKAVFNNKFKNSIVRSDAPKALLSDEQYETLVEEKIKEMDVINLGLNRLGLDESQVKEIKPVIVKDKIVKNKTSLLVYNPSDDSLHSSTQFVTILYLTDSQLFQYDIKFDMCCNYKEESTREIFYDDICDVSTHLEKITHNNNIVNSFSVKQESYRPEQIINSEVSKAKFEENIMSCYIFTSNSVFNFAVNDSDLEKVFSIKAMMQKIRDKKNA